MANHGGPTDENGHGIHMSRLDLLGRAMELRSGRIPHVIATVIRAESPTSAKPGDMAVILPDGTIEGFVGGSCAENTVRVESQRVLSSREPCLLRIAPDVDGGSGGVSDGVKVVSNPCLSGGTLEMFLEPEFPNPLVFVYGDGPIARALLESGAQLEFDVRSANLESVFPDDLAGVVIATYGSGETEVIKKAISSEVPYIGLVASRRRGGAVLDSMDLEEHLTAKVHTPAGIDIGAQSPPEIALSIFAELVAERPRAEKAGHEEAGNHGGVAIDPVCAMEVAQVGSSLRLVHDGLTYWFCGPGCQGAFADNPRRYLAR